MWEETDKQVLATILAGTLPYNFSQLNATKVLIASESANVLDAARRACESQLSTWIDTVQAQYVCARRQRQPLYQSCAQNAS